MDKDTYLTIETNQVERIEHFHDKDRFLQKIPSRWGVLIERITISINQWRNLFDCKSREC